MNSTSGWPTNWELYRPSAVDLIKLFRLRDAPDIRWLADAAFV